MALSYILKRWKPAIGLGMVALTFEFAFWCSIQAAHAQQNASPELDVLRLRPNFYVIAGAGGNIAVETGPEGTILVNAGTAEAGGRVVAAIKKVADQPIRYIIDTSADRDFVGGNAVLSKAGRNIMAAGTEPLSEFERGTANSYPATIVSTEQILVRMSTPDGQKTPYPSEAWPQETFPDRRKDYYMNHEGIQIYREPAAHSDSDSMVLFRGSDVVVTGDIIDASRFPVIDIARGGSIQGEIEALNQVIDLSFRPMPFVFSEGGTYVVPGHGRIYDRQDAVEYRDMVVTIRDIIQDMIERGMTLPQIKEASPAKAYEREYGAKTGSWTTDDFVAAVYQGLAGKK
jgi:glyoxylase-like metal-dependent hydrolase (beta-lactamase superfamily II)